MGTRTIVETKLLNKTENKSVDATEQETKSIIPIPDLGEKSTANIEKASEPATVSTPNQSQISQSDLESTTQNIDLFTPAELNAKNSEGPSEEILTESAASTTQDETVEVAAVSPLTFSDINISTREALVNILCTTAGSGSFSPTSGSGVIIDERGVILTNAHIAQYFLLKDYPSKDFVDCIIRIGSPAQPRFRASLLFIPTIWIESNAKKIKQQSPRGNGENDYAFLLIQEPIRTGADLPDTFSSVDPVLDETAVKKGENVLIAGYPAGFLGGIAIQKDLYITSTITDIEGVFTFKEGTLDLFSIGGSIVAQQGVSGGAVVNKEKGLIGIIVTSSDGETTDERDLRAITLSHINRSLEENTSTTLNQLLSGDLLQKTLDFKANTAPALTKLLVDVLE